VVVFGWLIILWLAGWILFDLFFSLRVNGFTGRSYSCTTVLSNLFETGGRTRINFEATGCNSKLKSSD